MHLVDAAHGRDHLLEHVKSHRCHRDRQHEQRPQCEAIRIKVVAAWHRAVGDDGRWASRRQHQQASRGHGESPNSINKMHKHFCISSFIEYKLPLGFGGFVGRENQHAQ
jgi:hypothetical protein